MSSIPAISITRTPLQTINPAVKISFCSRRTAPNTSTMLMDRAIVKYILTRGTHLRLSRRTDCAFNSSTQHSADANLLWGLNNSEETEKLNIQDYSVSLLPLIRDGGGGGGGGGINLV